MPYRPAADEERQKSKKKKRVSYNSYVKIRYSESVCYTPRRATRSLAIYKNISLRYSSLEITPRLVAIVTIDVILGVGGGEGGMIARNEIRRSKRSTGEFRRLVSGSINKGEELLSRSACFAAISRIWLETRYLQRSALSYILSPKTDENR